MPVKVSQFAGIVPNDARDTIRGRDSNASRRYWRGMDQLDWELKQLLIGAGWFADVPSTFKQLSIELRYTARHGVVPADSGWRQAKKIYCVCVEANGVGLAESPSDEERYWPLKRSCVQALIYAVEAIGGSPGVLQRLNEASAQIPDSPPWPMLPPFAPELSARFSEPVDGDAAGGGISPPAATGNIVDAHGSLPDEPGTLWLMIAIPTEFSTESEDRLIDEIKSFMQRSDLGEWDGDSSGGQALDVSFEVASLQRAAKGLASFLSQNFSTVKFRVSDEYEPTLDGGAGAAGADPVPTQT
jgi:hypothetical protein